MRTARRAAVLAGLWLAAAVVVAAQLPPYGGAPALLADLAGRRAALMAALGPESVFVVWSAPPRVYSADIDYGFRQDSNLLYLTGLDQEDSILVLVPGATTRREVLFTKAADPTSELWTGHVLSPAEVTARTGVANVITEHGTEAFDAFMTSLFTGATATTQGDEFAAVMTAEKAGRARLAIVGRLGGPDAGTNAVANDGPESKAHVAWALEMQRRFPGVTVVNAESPLTRQRQIKTPYEQALLTRSTEISSEAQVEGMKATKPGRWDNEVEAAIQFWSLKHGAMSWGYPSIVASGPNATTLHYMKSTRQMQNGELLLVDAASNYQGLTGDITRTYPVNGRFTPDERALYDLVLRAQEAGIAAARPGGESDEIVTAIRTVFADGLRRLGLLVDEAGKLDERAQVSLWFPHGPVHGIGVDVHDPLGRLDPGAAFVIEPGLYIRPDVLDRLASAPESAALAERLRPAVERFKNLGVRIEDSFLMSRTGPIMLSAKAPRQAADLERVVGTGP